MQHIFNISEFGNHCLTMSANGPATNPRKFSEKIALLKQRETETNAQFEVAMQITKQIETPHPQSPSFVKIEPYESMDSGSSSPPYSVLAHRQYQHLLNQRTSSLPNVPVEVSRTKVNLRHALEELQTVSAVASGKSPDPVPDARKRLKSQIQSRLPHHQRSLDHPEYPGSYLSPLPGDALQYYRRASSDTAIPLSVSIVDQNHLHQQHQQQQQVTGDSNPLTPPTNRKGGYTALPRAQSHDHANVISTQGHTSVGGSTGSLPDLHMSHLSPVVISPGGGPAPRKRVMPSVPSPLVIDGFNQQVGLCQSSCPTSPLAGVVMPAEMTPCDLQQYQNTVQLQRFQMDGAECSQLPQMNVPDGTFDTSYMLAMLGDNRGVSYKGAVDPLQQSSSKVPDIVLTEPDIERRDSFTFTAEVLAGLYDSHSSNVIPPHINLAEMPGLQISQEDLELLNDPDGMHGIDPATEDALRLEHQQHYHQQQHL